MPRASLGDKFLPFLLNSNGLDSAVCDVNIQDDKNRYQAIQPTRALGFIINKHVPPTVTSFRHSERAAALDREPTDPERDSPSMSGFTRCTCK